MTKELKRGHPKQSWKECAEMYRRLWLVAKANSDKYEQLRNLLK